MVETSRIRGPRGGVWNRSRFESKSRTQAADSAGGPWKEGLDSTKGRKANEIKGSRGLLASRFPPWPPSGPTERGSSKTSPAKARVARRWPRSLARGSAQPPRRAREREEPRVGPLSAQCPARPGSPKQTLLGLPLPGDPCCAPQRRRAPGTPGGPSHKAWGLLGLGPPPPLMPPPARLRQLLGSLCRLQTRSRRSPAPPGGERGVASRVKGWLAWRPGGCLEQPEAASPGSHAEKPIASLPRSRDFGRKG